jgi:hypothetical protein
MELNGLLNPGSLLTGESIVDFIMLIDPHRFQGIFQGLRVCQLSLTLQKGLEGRNRI